MLESTLFNPWVGYGRVLLNVVSTSSIIRRRNAAWRIL